jgi:hypothetical protein
VEGGLKLENDFLLRIRHFVSDEVRYPVLRVLLTPLMFFDRTSVVPRVYLDFGENIQVNEEFHLRLDVEFDPTVLSNCYMSVSSILKAQHVHTEGQSLEPMESGMKVPAAIGEESEHLFSIGEEEEMEQKEKVEKEKIEKIIALVRKEPKKEEGKPPAIDQNDEEFIDASDEDDDEEYLKNLEERA